jgi:hypothetical protein
MPRATRPFTENPKPASTRSGCAVGLTLIGVVTFLIAWGVYTFVRQDRAIGRFTGDSPLELALEAPAPEAAADLGRRLAAFAGPAPTELALTAIDLNALVATRPELAPLRGLLRFEAVRDGAVHATVSFPLRRFGSTEPRYLNGNLAFVPQVAGGRLTLDLRSLEAPGKVIDAGFVTNYRHEGYLDSLLVRPFERNAEAWPVVTSLGSVEVGDGVVVARRGDGRGG